ncbi:MAG: hypothetical protein LBR65_01195 [Culturomica sp.]|jgi:hypothetical protein|nr:hypothetical protein [Culturomica sp.]
MKICAFVICLPALCAGCVAPETPTLRKLQAWDGIVDERPEAVRDSLQTLRLHRLNRGEKAYYALLDAVTSNKMMLPLKSDSALRVAEIYYESHKQYGLLARTQLYIGQYHYKKQDIETAFHTLKEAESHARKSGSKDPRTLALICYWLGQTHMNQMNFAEALKYTYRSAGIYEELKDTIQWVAVLNAVCYLHSWQEEQLPEAASVLSSCRRLLEAVDSRKPRFLHMYVSTLNNYDLLFQRQNQLDSALYYNTKCIDIVEQNHLPFTFSLYLSRISLLYQLGLYDECRSNCLELLEPAEKEENRLYLANIYQHLFLSTEKLGAFEQACRYREKCSQIKDELNTHRETDALRELEQKYNVAEKEKEVLTWKNLWLLILAILLGVVLCLALVSLIVIHRKRKLQKQHDLLAEKVVRTQWGYALSRKVIAYNFNTFEEVEKLINRNTQHVTDHFLHEFKRCSQRQKRAYFEALYSVVREVDLSFTKAFEQLYPELPQEEAMLAFLIREQWELGDIASILDISFEAAKKRRYRLKAKLMGDTDKETSLIEFLKRISR